MKRELEFYKLVERQNIITLVELESGVSSSTAAVYVNKICSLAKAYGMEDFPNIRIIKPASNIGMVDARDALFLLENYMNDLYSQNIFEYENDNNYGYLILDEDWRAKATSYVSHIREVVTKADLPIDLNEVILNRLNDLQSEIDRDRTRLNAAVDTWFTITDAIGKGAKNLEPAAALTKKMMDAFSGLWKKSQATEPPKLPPPDQLGLPNLSDEDANSDDGD